MHTKKTLFFLLTILVFAGVLIANFGDVHGQSTGIGGWLWSGSADATETIPQTNPYLPTLVYVQTDATTIGGIVTYDHNVMVARCNTDACDNVSQEVVFSQTSGHNTAIFSTQIAHRESGLPIVAISYLPDPTYPWGKAKLRIISCDTTSCSSSSQKEFSVVGLPASTLSDPGYSGIQLSDIFIASDGIPAVYISEILSPGGDVTGGNYIAKCVDENCNALIANKAFDLGTTANGNEPPLSFGMNYQTVGSYLQFGNKVGPIYQTIWNYHTTCHDTLCRHSDNSVVNVAQGCNLATDICASGNVLKIIEQTQGRNYPATTFYSEKSDGYSIKNFVTTSCTDSTCHPTGTSPFGWSGENIVGNIITGSSGFPLFFERAWLPGTPLDPQYPDASIVSCGDSSCSSYTSSPFLFEKLKYPWSLQGWFVPSLDTLPIFIYAQLPSGGGLYTMELVKCADATCSTFSNQITLETSGATTGSVTFFGANIIQDTFDIAILPPLKTDLILPEITGGIGWVSLASTNDELTEPDITSYGINYGLAIDAADDSNIAGFAWSENVGWIDFNPAGPYPDTPDNSAKLDGTTFTGWARIVSIKDALEDTTIAGGNSGGWEGWIKLSGTAQDGSSYGVEYDTSKNELAGFAWSNEFGWIDFSGKTGLPPPPPEEICGNGIDDDGDGIVDGPSCPEGGIGTCTDGVDNDGDGLIDAADPDCGPPPVIASCSATDSPTIPEAGGSVTVVWNATAIGGSGSYTYDWDPVDPIPLSTSETGATYSTDYDSPGEKSVMITVTSSGDSDSFTCSVELGQEGDITEIPPFF